MRPERAGHAAEIGMSCRGFPAAPGQRGGRRSAHNTPLCPVVSVAWRAGGGGGAEVTFAAP